MPPGKRLKDEEIGALRRWIEADLPFTAETAQKKQSGRDHWSFQVPKHPATPAVQNSAWVRNPIDAFVMSRLEREHIAPSREAERATLLRRVSLDITGIPPTPAEVRAFLADKSQNTYEKVVDRLLASPHYGERWGRHWLDVARYADSDGYTIDAPRQIWKYRDWVINALNRDMPFDQFVDRADCRRPAARTRARPADRHRLPPQYAESTMKAASISNSTASKRSWIACRPPAPPFSG